MRTAMTAATLVLALAGPSTAAAVPLTPKEQILWAALKTRLDGIADRLDGVMGYSVKDLKSGATLERHADLTFPLASSIKLAVLYELYAQAGEGKLDLAEIRRPGPTRVGGGGVLQELGTDVSLTWRDLAVLMMGWSDNEATNVLIDKVTLASVNERLSVLGLSQTRLRRRMMDLEAARRGDENVGTPSEMRRLIEVLQQGTGLAPARAQDLLKVAATPKDSSFRVPLPEELRVMDKPGALEGVRCVTALVDLAGRPYTVSLMTTYLRRDADGEAAIRDASQALFETFSRFSRSSDLGRIISLR